MKLRFAISLVLALTVAPAAMGALSSDPGRLPPTNEEEGCDSVNAFELLDSVIPSITVRVCGECRFGDSERFALLRSYGEAARRAGYIVDPLNSSLLVITEIGVLPNGKPYLKGVIGNNQLTVGDPFPGETLATVAGKLALVVVSSGH